MANKAVKNRQHYVPKFYLRNFSESDKAIASFNITNVKYIKNASIRNMCQKNNFYGADNEVEDFLSDKIEGNSATTIKQILQNGTLPKDPEKYLEFLMFILVTEARNVKLSDTLDHMVDFLSKFALSMKTEFDEVEIDKLNVSLNNGVLMLIENAMKMTPTIADLAAVVITEKTNARKFLASDNPVIRYNHLYLSKNYLGGFGLSGRGLMIFIPLSHEKCLLLYDEKVYKIPQLRGSELLLNKAKDVDIINELIYLNSYNNVFAHQKIKEEYLLKLHNKNHSVPKMNDLEREATRVKITNINEEAIYFSPNKVTKLLGFSWLHYTEYGKRLIMPLHMGGIQREESLFLSKMI